MPKVNYYEKYRDTPHSVILSDVADLLQAKIGLSFPLILELATLIKSQQDKEIINNIESCFGIKLTQLDYVALHKLRRAEQHMMQSAWDLVAILSTYNGQEIGKNGQ